MAVHVPLGKQAADALGVLPALTIEIGDKMFKFLHAADIHLDSPLRGLAAYEGAPVELLRGATRVAFRNLIDLAIREEVAFIVIAGDLYDGTWRDYQTGLFLIS